MHNNAAKIMKIQQIACARAVLMGVKYSVGQERIGRLELACVIAQT